MSEFQHFREKFNDDADAIVFRATELFLLGDEGERPLNADEISPKIGTQFPQYQDERRFNRNDAYKAVRAALEQGTLLWRPPPEKALSVELAKRFPLPGVDFQVVDTRSSSNTSIFLAQRAAEVVHEEISLRLKLNPKGKIGLGMGPGSTTLAVCRQLANLLRDNFQERFLNLFGISSGCPPWAPSHAPISFFNLLPQHIVGETVALLTDPLIPADQYETRKLELGLRDAFQKKEGVDIVITSMGDCHLHDDLLAMLELGQDQIRKRIGSVQYRFYDDNGPILEAGSEKRVATLFELDELSRMAKPESGKSVILIARPCPYRDCNRTKARALRPLLNPDNPQLHVFNHLVLDTKTASQLLFEPEE